MGSRRQRVGREQGRTAAGGRDAGLVAVLAG